MTKHPSNDNQTVSSLDPDGLRRKFLRVGTLSSAAIASLLASRSSAAAAGDDLADQVRELTAREEIKELRAKYCWYATRADAKSYAKLFTSDCVFEYKVDGKRQLFKGRDAISAIVAAIAPGTVTPVIGNHTITLAGNEASGTCTARNSIRSDDGTAVMVTGFYEDKFRFEQGQWRFAARRWFTYSPEYEENEVRLD